jgi:predicted transcriptional regulator
MTTSQTGLSVSTIDPKQLKKIRVQLGITQSELARAAGVSQSLIAKLESGLVDPSFSTMKSISEALRSQIRIEGKKASEVMSKPVISIQSTVTISDSVNAMKKNGISQLPVYSGTRLVGSITENQIVQLLSTLDDPRSILGKPISSYLQPTFPIVSADTPVEALFSLFKFVPAILVATGDKVEGVITKIDMLSAEV